MRSCECHARMAGECACGAWDEPLTSSITDAVHYASDGSSDQMHSACGLTEDDDTKIVTHLGDVTCVKCLHAVIATGERAAARWHEVNGELIAFDLSWCQLCGEFRGHGHRCEAK